VLRPATSAALPAAVVSSDIQPAPETLAVDATDSSSIDVSNFLVICVLLFTCFIGLLW